MACVHWPEMATRPLGGAGGCCPGPPGLGGAAAGLRLCLEGDENILELDSGDATTAHEGPKTPELYTLELNYISIKERFRPNQQRPVECVRSR